NFPYLNAAPRQNKKTQNPLQQGFCVLNNKLFLPHSQIFQNFFKVIREPCLELETFTALGMCESDGVCVQHLAARIQRFSLAVFRVANERVADIFHMDTDLVGSSGL